jgi:hypothetical protein
MGLVEMIGKGSKKKIGGGDCPEFFLTKIQSTGF